jgi:selenocysteine lyase/cysteine desulfurase
MTPLDQLRALWEPELRYLDTASYGLPPRPAWDALRQALDDWRTGRGRWERWNEATGRARELFGRLVGVTADRVAVGSTVSGLVGLVAASIPDGTRVVVPEPDFRSLLYPWLVNGERLRVQTVPLAQLADAVTPGVGVVAFSAVQSATGELADLAAIEAAARAAGAVTVVDATHACGWLALDAGRFDAVAVAGYKWLLSPRGTAFMTVSERLLERTRPLAAGWFASDDPHGGYYGPPLSLAPDARRLDVSPAWFSWVGCEPALRVLLDAGVEAIHRHDLALANRFRAGLGLPAGDSAIVTLERPDAAERLEAAGVRAATRAGSLRASFHLYNTEADVDAALDALGA